MFSRVPLESEPQTLRDRITVLAIAVDRSLPTNLESALRSEADLEIRTAATVASMLEQLDDVDCLVVVAADSSADAGASASDEPDDERESNANAAGALERIRSHVPDLPIVAVTVVDDRDGHRESTSPVDSTSRSHRWTAHVPVTADGPAADLERVTRRVRHLVERRRLGALSRRSLAGLELAQDPIAIAAPDGTLEFANRRFAVQFGDDRAALPGRSWRACFTDETVAHLESTAIPTVADGWRWTGRCTGRRRSGETFPAHVRLGGLPDGSLAFAVSELEAADDGPNADPPEGADGADRSDDSRRVD